MATEGGGIYVAVFLSTPSARRATVKVNGTLRVTLFLSTPSARRATQSGFPPWSPELGFLSTPSARRATGDLLPVGRVRVISIHALREEGDPAPG